MSGRETRVPERSLAGKCPNCGQEIPVWDVLVEYETADGECRKFADCAGCDDVVHPV